MSCKIEGCDRPVKAKSLCARHYTRARRTGDPTVVRQAGRPRDPGRTGTRLLFPEWSDRTFDRFWRAQSMVLALEGADAWERARREATRANGSLNVSKLEQAAHLAVYRGVRDRDHAER